MIGKYSLPNMLFAYKNNKEIIHAYLKGDVIEGYTNKNDNKVLGMGIAAFLGLLVLGLILWVWALYILVKYWDELEDWAKILGILSLLFGLGGPIVTIIVVYIGKMK